MRRMSVIVAGAMVVAGLGSGVAAAEAGAPGAGVGGQGGGAGVGGGGAPRGEPAAIHRITHLPAVFVEEVGHPLQRSTS
uniref:hypothetical protein n=1 Tax=Nocardia cyriacigeorgica TaxID=135487 RepID=UPI002455A411